MKESIKLFFLLIFIISCKKEADYVVPAGNPNTPIGNFDAFWNGIDQNYVFFNQDPVNWDNVYNENRSKVSSTTTKAELKEILKLMLKSLIDGHKKIEFEDSTSYSGRQLDGTVLNLNLTQNIVNNYINNASTLKGNIPGTNIQSDEIVLGTIKNKSISYINQRYFGNALQDLQNQVNFNNFVSNSNSNSGLILDLRNNTGGEARAFYNLCSRFVSGSYTWGYSQFRISRNRYEMSPFLAEKIEGASVSYLNKMVILVNKNSASASEITAIALKSRSNVVIMGDTTFGANGPLSDIVRYTGNFYLPNGWKVTLAQRITYDLNKNIYEGKGLIPNQVIKQDVNAFGNGKDNVLESAIKYLDN